MATSSHAQLWQIDFEANAGGAFGSIDPITSSYEGVWNAFRVEGTNDTLSNAVTNPSVQNLLDAANNPTNVNFAINGKLSAYNSVYVSEGPSSELAFLNDHFFFAQASSTTTLQFTFSGLPTGIYDFVAHVNPTLHAPPRDFSFTIDGMTTNVIPSDPGVDFSIVGNSASLMGITVDASGTIQGSFDPIAGDPSIAGVSLQRVPEPTKLSWPALLTLVWIRNRSRRPNR